VLGTTGANPISSYWCRLKVTDCVNIFFFIYSFGPFKGAQPTGTYWAQDFPHTAWYDLSEYYITAFKTGSYPAITVRFLNFRRELFSSSFSRKISFISGPAPILRLLLHPAMVLESPPAGTGLRSDIPQKRIYEVIDSNSGFHVGCGLCHLGSFCYPQVRQLVEHIHRSCRCYQTQDSPCGWKDDRPDGEE